MHILLKHEIQICVMMYDQVHAMFVLLVFHCMENKMWHPLYVCILFYSDLFHDYLGLEKGVTT